MLCEHGNIAPCVECDIEPLKAENKTLRSFLAGITLAGYQRKDGTVEMDGVVIEGWPDTVTVAGVVFNKEVARFVGTKENPRGMYMNVEYL